MLSACADYQLNPAEVQAPQKVAVADGAYGRVLLYDTPVVMNQSATVVLGQPDFSQGEQIIPLSANTLFAPVGLASDAGGDLFVSDWYACRVLEFRPGFTDGMNASVVIGKPDFTTGGCNTHVDALRDLQEPSMMAVDGKGDLWVADADCRINEYVPPFSNGMAASVALGSPTLDKFGVCGHDARSLYLVGGIAFDPQGDLWVSDQGNNRILEFKPPFSTGMAASLALGQPAATGLTDPNQSCSDVSASSVCEPLSLAFDARGDLWAVDYRRYRVLEFIPPFSSGMAASLVIGQPDMTYARVQASPTANTMSPAGVAFDRAGHLLVSDGAGDRILLFAPPFSTGMSAYVVIGQPGMETNTQSSPCGTPAANDLCWPDAVAAF